MDIWNFIGFIVIFLPLFFGLYLVTSRIKLALVSKKVLNFGLGVINLINLIFVSILAYFILMKNFIVDFGFESINFLNVETSFRINIDKNNIIFLFAASLFYFLINLFVIKFFKTKKQFLFTKQRYYILFSILIFNTYLFICSSCLLEALIFWMSQGAIIFIFSYFDIFKTNTSANITRFYRLNLLSDFSFLAAFMLFFKYAVLQKSFIETTSINFNELNTFVSYMLGISSLLEYKIAIAALLIAIFSKLIIFPFSCYYSFFANSSAIVYLPVMICANNLLAAYLYLKILPMLDYFPDTVFMIYIFTLLTIFTSLIFLLFEKNTKIIFGYLLSILNAGFILGALVFKYTNCVYFACLFFFLAVLIKLFSIDKINFSRRIVNKNKGFYLEKLHIIAFENLPNKTAAMVLFIFKYIFGFIFKILNKFMNMIINVFVIRYIKADKSRVLRNIFLVFGIFIIFTIFLILFGGADFG